MRGNHAYYDQLPVVHLILEKIKAEVIEILVRDCEVFLSTVFHWQVLWFLHPQEEIITSPFRSISKPV